MASRFWVGGTASINSSNSALWSNVSGGASGFTVGTTDDVKFDAGSGAVTASASFSTYSWGSLDCTGFTGTLDLSTSSPEITINVGDVILGASMTFIDGGGNVFSFVGSGTQFFTTNGQATIYTGIFRDSGTNSTGVVKFSQDTSILDCGTGIGTFDLNNHNLTARYFSGAGPASGSAGLVLGSGTLTVGQSATTVGHGVLGGGGFFEIVGTVANFNVTAGTGKIVLINTTDNQPTYFNGAGKTFNNLEFAAHNGKQSSIQGSNTFNNVKFDGNIFVTVDGGSTQTTATGPTVPISPTNGIVLQSSSGVRATFSSSNPQPLNFYGTTFEGILASGSGAPFWATDGSNHDGGNNSGIIFAAPPFNDFGGPSQFLGEW